MLSHFRGESHISPPKIGIYAPLSFLWFIFYEDYVMIELTKLNKKKFMLNCDLIETIESTPDTVITLRNGKLCIVEESPEQVLSLTIEYKRKIISGLFAQL